MNVGYKNNFPLTLTAFIVILKYIAALDYFDDGQAVKYVTQTLHLREIPKRFEIKGANVKKEFEKYADNIQELAKQQNVTVIYKIKVIVAKPHSTKKFSKKMTGRKTKKYNVPLKKKSMKLSNFELTMRRMIEEKGKLDQLAEAEPTTESQITTFATRIPPVWKYKPIISRVRTNYTKVIKPVKIKEITLNS